MKENLIKIHSTFEHLTSKIKAQNNQHPYARPIVSSLPIFKKIFETCQSDPSIIQASSLCLKHFFYTTHVYVETPFLTEILPLLVTHFSLTFDCNILALLADIYCVYGPTVKNLELYSTVLNMITSSIFSLFENELRSFQIRCLPKDDKNILSRKKFCFYTEHPDLIEDYFHVLEVISNECPNVLLQTPNLDSIWDFAVNGM